MTPNSRDPRALFCSELNSLIGDAFTNMIISKMFWKWQKMYFLIQLLDALTRVFFPMVKVGPPMPAKQQASYYGVQDAPWQYGHVSGGGIYDNRTRAPETRVFTMRSNQRSGSGFRASSQPPGAFVTGPPINSHASWCRGNNINTNGWNGPPAVSASAGSLDKVNEQAHMFTPAVMWSDRQLIWLLKNDNPGQF